LSGRLHFANQLEVFYAHRHIAEFADRVAAGRFRRGVSLSALGCQRRRQPEQAWRAWAWLPCIM